MADASEIDHEKNRPSAARNPDLHAAAGWPIRLLTGAREPDFHGDESAEAAEILLSHPVDESDRESLYELELLRMFRQRLRLNALLALVLIPLFHLFYFQLSPSIAHQMRLPHGLIVAVCALFLLAPVRIVRLVWARLLTVFGYSLICMSASLVMVISSQNQFGAGALTGLQLAMLAAHSQILLSTVLLPLTLWEGLVMTAIVAFSLVWSSWWAMPFESGSVQTSQAFVLLTTAVFVLCVIHSQWVLRRRAFNTGFDLKRAASQLQTLSVLDPVTGGFNRFYLERTLSIETSRAARFSRPLSAMMFDLDNFKIVNDTQGHTTGDEVLRLVNEAVSLAIRDVDTVARYGGDEFMVVLPETERDEALQIGERVQDWVHAHLEKRFGDATPQGRVTLSIGIITLHPTEPLPTGNIIALADERLYEAKRMGKNRIAA